MPARSDSGIFRGRDLADLPSKAFGQGAEGATAPETLRQTDRAGMGTLESANVSNRMATEGEGWFANSLAG